MTTVFTRFSEGAVNASNLFRADFRSKVERLATIEQIKNKKLHPTTIKVLEKLNVGISPQVDANLLKITTKACSVVITGQQLSVLGGPLLTLYKILSCVRVASELSLESDSPVIPLFWLQSEDHDFKEIAESNFLSGSEELKTFNLASLEAESGDSVGAIVLDQNIQDNLSGFLENLGPADSQTLNHLVNSYSKGQTLCSAFRQFWQNICASLGVLFFDPSEPEIKKLAQSFIKKGFEHHAEISKILIERADLLEKDLFEVQVAIKSDSPLWFISSNNKRERGILKESKFKTTSEVIEYSELLSLIAKKPEIFSASALIRPIFQDWLFPTAAYICGPSEFNYWAQLQPLYEFFEVLQPLVIPRASFILVEEKYKKLLAKSGCSIEDVLKPAEELIKSRFQSTELDSSILFSFIESRWTEDIRSLKDPFSRVDHNLIGPLTQTEDGIKASISRLKARYERSLLEKESSSVKQIKRIQSALLPTGAPQERILSAASYLLKHGKSLLEQVMGSIDPFENFNLKVLYLKESPIYLNLERKSS